MKAFRQVFSRRKRLAVAWLGLALTVAACLSGCATTEDQSDIPWNVPQSWEGHPGIPGLTDQGSR